MCPPRNRLGPKAETDLFTEAQRTALRTYKVPGTLGNGALGMDHILKHLGSIIKKQLVDVEQAPLPECIVLNLIHLRRSEQE